ncbi:tripartite tricarboxylate transporter substrate binding protein [Ramlibacter sp.]|uniref:Bug family tripartite tricarboxylate transporter substrate binding protein n=1 Tax=Ramlibacter sp. TaxID=1917967 RepID=UPI0025D43726|nr:tripartite tricarboxylate transporter substrate binding protein [Ramlibacter sp.]
MNESNKTSRRTAMLAVPALLAGLGTVRAQPAWPTRPIRWVVGYPPGGITDVMARLMAQKVGADIGQQITIENRPGASSNIAALEVARAGGEGQAFLFAPTGVETANPWLYKSQLVPSRDLQPVCAVASSQLYLVARPDLPGSDARALVAQARSTPGRMTYASAGNATPPHLAGELFKQQAQIFVTHIPYRGAAPALQDVASGQVDFVFDPGSALPFIRAGKVKLLGVASARRSPFFPETPTLAEQGVKASELDIWYGLWAPPATPADVVGTLGNAVRKALVDADVRQRFATFAAEPQWLDQRGFKTLLNRESEMLASLIKARGIAAE